MNATRRIEPNASVTALLIDLALVVAILLVYAQTLGFDFAKVDDTFYVTKNPHVLGGLTASNVSWAFHSFEASNWHPLTWISLMADATIGGGKPWAFHATNVLFHAANALLLFHLLLSTTRSIAKSALVAALFAVHPLHVESVAWITERKDVLSTFFWLLALAAHVAYAKRPGAARYAVVVGAFVLGALSKPMVVTLPLTLLLFDAWPLDRLGPLSRRAFVGFTPVVEKIPLLFVSAASSAVTLFAQRTVEAPLSSALLGPRLAGVVVAYATYLVRTIWPVSLSIHHLFADPIPVWKVAASALALAAATWLAIASFRHHRYVTVGWLWYVVTLVPVIGFVQVGDQSIADRYTYVPSIGLFIIVAWGVPDLMTRFLPDAKRRSAALRMSAGLALSGLAMLSHRQAGYWRNAFELFQHAVAVNGESALARMGFGQELAARGRDAEAIEQYRAALALRPGAIFAHQHLAECLERTGRLSEAADEFRALLRLDPGSAQAELGLGVVLLQQDKASEAVTELERAVSSDPADAGIRATLGLALTRVAELDKAEAAFEEALRMDPKSALAHKGIAVVLGNTGRTEEAIGHLRRALAIDPNQPDARTNLATLLRRLGKLEEAAAVMGSKN